MYLNEFDDNIPESYLMKEIIKTIAFIHVNYILIDAKRHSEWWIRTKWINLELVREEGNEINNEFRPYCEDGNESYKFEQWKI